MSRAPGFQPDRLREMAKTYYTDFRPAIELYNSEPKQFTQASDRGLTRLDELEQAAHEIDKLGEKRASIALKSVEEVSSIARVLLIALVGGLILIGATLAYAAVRMVGQIREAREQLARALRAKMDFLADASHELRTPLTVVHTNAEVGAQLEVDPSQREIFEDIVNESSQMSRMVENLLFLARSDSESPPLEMEIIAVPTFLAALEGRAEPLARGRGASFEANLSGEGYLRADPARLEQAVLILVDNAAKYSSDGKLVTLFATTESGELLIRVEDRGPGIPEEHLPHIFERFYRVDKARTRKQEGAGLGLSIAQTIVQAHGGRIEAESHIGEGTQMSLHLPLAADESGRTRHPHTRTGPCVARASPRRTPQSRQEPAEALRRTALPLLDARHLEAAAWPLAAVAALPDRHARNLGDESLGHAANLGVLRCQSGQRTTVAPNDKGAVPLLDFRQSAQLVEHAGGRLEPRACAVRRCSLALSQAATYRPQ